MLSVVLVDAAVLADETELSYNACGKTTRVAFNACLNEITDDFWIAVGTCVNSRNRSLAKACQQEEQKQRRVRLQECRQQRAVRQEICDRLGAGPYDPVIDPANFLSPGETAANPNPYFPLVPGTIRRYTAGDETIEVTVTDETKDILGVVTTVVRDVVSIDGELVEDTFDWYAQDRQGNVWYLGEIAKNYEEGELVNLDGSWKSGVDGAKPGILMKASPQVGDIYRQEFFLGEAEDMGEVLDVAGSATVPGASCHGECVVTRDFLPLEPGVNEYKYYAPGIGAILTIDVETGERTELVEVIIP